MVLVEVDGIAIADKIVTLSDDAVAHEVRVVLGNQLETKPHPPVEGADLSARKI